MEVFSHRAGRHFPGGRRSEKRVGELSRTRHRAHYQRVRPDCRRRLFPFRVFDLVAAYPDYRRHHRHRDGTTPQEIISYLRPNTKIKAITTTTRMIKIQRSAFDLGGFRSRRRRTQSTQVQAGGCPP